MTEQANCPREARCKDLVRKEFKKEMRTLRNLWKTYCGDSEKQDETEQAMLTEYGLGFWYEEPDERHREGWFCYQLSTGGPGDEFRFFVNPDMSVYKVEYWYLDWFDGAKVIAKGGDFEFLEEFWNGYFRDFAEEKMNEVLKR